jgi:hypothetical protein
MKTNLLKYYTAAFYLCSTFVASAQPGTEDSGGASNLEGTDTPVSPIDGYVWVLSALGLVYVFLRIRAFAQQGNNPQD